MTVSRRGFLGSVLGTLVASKLPFVVEEAVIRPSSKLIRITRFVRLFQIPESKLYKCRIYAKTNDGICFFVPRIKKIDRDLENLGLKMECEGIYPTQSITMQKLGIFDDENQFIRETNLPKDICMINGDTLKLMYSMNMDI